MILDEIEEMSSTLNRVYDNLEQIYAIYIREFPEKNRTIDELKQTLHGANLSTEGEHEHSGPRHDTYSNGALVPVKTFDIREELEQEQVPEQTVEGYEKPKESEAAVMGIRQLFRKLNQLCHPDKCKRFSHEETARLRDCFVQAGEAYSNRDYHMLELLYMRVCYIRNELHRLDERTVNAMRSKHTMLCRQMEKVSFHPLYTVLQCHMHQMYAAAMQHFDKFLDTQIQELKEELGSH